MQENRIPAIETTYAGCLFRSRLEAHWAAFFDLVSWRWDYEPLDLNGWIPDFVLHGRDSDIFVEVKPFSVLAEYDTKKVTDAIKNTGHFGKEILLLAATITAINDLPRIGWIGTVEPEIGWTEYEFSEAGLTQYGPADQLGRAGDPIGFCSLEQSYHDRMSGYYIGGATGGLSNHEAMSLWREAGNRTRWMPGV